MATIGIWVLLAPCSFLARTSLWKAARRAFSIYSTREIWDTSRRVTARLFSLSRFKGDLLRAGRVFGTVPQGERWGKFGLKKIFLKAIISTAQPLEPRPSLQARVNLPVRPEGF